MEASLSMGDTIKIPNDVLKNDKAFFGMQNEVVKRLQSVTTGNLLSPTSYDDEGRPDLTGQAGGVVIYNTTTALLNVWNGAGWTLTDGTPA